jgi:hypothetical protein
MQDKWSDLLFVPDQGPEPRSNWINYFFVESPDGVPLERDERLRRALGEHKLLECLHRHTTATNSCLRYQHGLKEEYCRTNLER